MVSLSSVWVLVRLTFLVSGLLLIIGMLSPMLIPSVPVSEGIEIRHGCQFISSLVRASSKLPGGMGRFLPCGVGPHIWSRINVLMVSLRDHWILVTINALVRCVGVLGCPKGSAASFLTVL